MLRSVTCTRGVLYLLAASLVVIAAEEAIGARAWSADQTRPALSSALVGTGLTIAVVGLLATGYAVSGGIRFERPLAPRRRRASTW
jgi:hypothetical protein